MIGDKGRRNRAMPAVAKVLAFTDLLALGPGEGPACDAQKHIGNTMAADNGRRNTKGCVILAAEMRPFTIGCPAN